MLKEQDLQYLQNVLTFWERLTLTQKKKLENHTKPIYYKKGERIHGGGLDCIGVLLIKSGNLRVYILSEEGKEVTLYRLTKGELCILSASCILKNITFDVQIDAETDSEVLLIPTNIYDNLCKENIYVDNFTDKTVIDRFSDVMWAMQQILFMSFDKRLAIFLHDEITRNKTDRIEMTHEQIAKYVGSAREVVTRMLKYFVEEGIVYLYRGGVEVIDKKKLQGLTY